MNVNKMTPYERTIQFLNDMELIYIEEVRDPSSSYSYKRKFVEVVGYKNNEKIYLLKYIMLV